MSKKIIQKLKMQLNTNTFITIFFPFSKRTSTFVLQVYGRLKWN